MANSRWPGWAEKTLDERTSMLLASGALTPADLSVLRADVSEALSSANQRIENVIGIHALPWAVATNFRVNGEDVLVPMAIEEPSVVAAASHSAKLVRRSGGFSAESTAHLMRGQIQLVDCPEGDGAERRLLDERERLLDLAASSHPSLIARGGGPRDLVVRRVGPMLVVELLVDTRNAMGANLINTMVEGLAPIVERIAGGRALLRILSNYADTCLGRASCVVDPNVLARPGRPGTRIRDDVVVASRFAEEDVWRAVTHNKGIMNGVDAVVLATGNDWRAVEAGAHAYAARNGRYSALATWRVNERGQLAGQLEMPLALGTAGAAIRAQPTAPIALKLMGEPSARRLAEIVAAVGLGQNLAALLALVTDGIQRGHMRLHARSEALVTGAAAGEDC